MSDPAAVGDAPHVRWPFRLLALLFVAAAVLMAGGLLRGLIEGSWRPGLDHPAESGSFPGCVVMTLAFAWAGFTGRVPESVWRLFQRFVRLA